MEIPRISKYTCSNLCCNMYIDKYDKKNDIHIPFSSIRNKKAGVFVYDPESDKILLVQSRLKAWGCPKGSINEGETVKECAIRELWEETGIIVGSGDLDDSTCCTIFGKATYFYKEMKECHISVPNILGNDVSGYTWIKMSCLHNMILNNWIWLNRDCRFLITHFLS